ncbi:MAG TPA: WD40 repeat domain-containing protein [Cyanobacteria bacterium UBA8803]|nr:WD40 repeat domain-containing protein [Cyanobacteria bacterium UBA9273]HBL57347.1 WD40 repeat domain-containing protein [Cyanobacteria bacterium UBA8803]
MEPWLNLFLEVAKPVLKTLVYAGTSSLLKNIQDELEEKQQRQAQMMLKSLGIDTSIELQKEAPAFQDKLAKLGCEKIDEIQQFIQNVTATIDQTDRNSQKLAFQQQKLLQQQLATYKRETLLQVAVHHRETMLQLPEVHKILDNWPLRLFPTQLLESRHPSDRLPLRIFVAPPQLPLDQFDEDILGMPDLELSLAQGLREFLSQKYPLHSPLRPTEFLGGAWESKRFHSESSIKALFGLLKSEPTLILESEIVGDFLNFRMAYWGLGQESYCYETILKVAYRELIYSSAKARAQKWKETRNKLLAVGRTLVEVNRLGGDKAINLAILEDMEELEQAGINTSELHFSYKVNSQDFQALCQFLNTCHCLVAGWVTDIHHLIHHDVSPLLPELLPQLTQDLPDETLLPATIQTTIAIYQDVFKALLRERPYWEPELALKLAQSLAHLSDKSWAKEQLDYSLKIWLQQRQVPQLEGMSPLEVMQSALTTTDRDYCETLKTCLLALGDDWGVSQVEEGIAAIASHQNNNGVDSTLTKQWENLCTIALSPDGQSLVRNEACNTIKLCHLDRSDWQPPSSYLIARNSGQVVTLAIGSDGQTIASCNQTQERSYIQIWHLQTGKLLRTLFGHRRQIHALAISPNGQTLASGSHKIKLWDLQTGEPLHTFFGHKKWVHALALSPDGRILVSGSEDKTIRIWNMLTEDLLDTLTGHLGSVTALAISPDGQTMVSGSEDKTVKVWNLSSRKLLHTFTDCTGGVRAVAISPDGQHLIGASEDTLKIWDLHQGKLLQTLAKEGEAVCAIAISLS